MVSPLSIDQLLLKYQADTVVSCFAEKICRFPLVLEEVALTVNFAFLFPGGISEMS